MIKHGNLLDVLPTLAPNSIDACVTDPPYGLSTIGRSFQGSGGTFKPNGLKRSERRTTGLIGQRWDGTRIAFRAETWSEVLRVMKPGSFLVAFGGTRTSHRMVGAIEDAGFEIRDSLCWLYGSGFPKSRNLGNGRGTALKPAHELIALARKPVEGTTTSNVERYGTGALNIDACRIGIDRCRFPSNVLLGEDGAGMIDTPTGTLRTGCPSRFFYVAKAARSERDAGCDGPKQNTHPTVKPLSLMRWLVRLVTPPEGTVLDPFMGSGTTGMACIYEGRTFIGIETEADYIDIANRRIKSIAPLIEEAVNTECCK